MFFSADDAKRLHELNEHVLGIRNMINKVERDISNIKDELSVNREDNQKRWDTIIGVIMTLQTLFIDIANKHEDLAKEMLADGSKSPPTTSKTNPDKRDKSKRSVPAKKVQNKSYPCL